MRYTESGVPFVTVPSALLQVPDGGLAAVQVLAKVAVVAGELAGHHSPDDRRDESCRAAKLPFGHEQDSRPGAVGLQRPGSVNRLRAFDDVYVQASWPLEFGELDNLLELLDARWFRAFAHARA